MFKGCPKLKRIVIGNTINAIGKEAFAECGTTNSSAKVVVDFHAPKDGYANFTMGKDAFTTGGAPLEFKGDVVEGYAPFDYAMDPDTYANAETWLRVCYKSHRPENITVILDNVTEEPTLVDYPHYEEIDKVNADYIEEMEEFWTKYYQEGGASHPDTPDGPWDDHYYENNPYSILDLYEHGNEYTEQFKRLTEEGADLVDAALNVVVPKVLPLLMLMHIIMTTIEKTVQIFRHIYLIAAVELLHIINIQIRGYRMQTLFMLLPVCSADIL